MAYVATSRQTSPDKQGMSVHVQDLTCLYCQGDKKAGIEKVSFDIETGSFVGIYGKSGIGKSVLIKQLRRGPSGHGHGTVLLDGMSPDAYINNEIAYYPQFIAIPELLTCREFLELANADRGNTKSHLQEKLDEILSQCALDRNILKKQIVNLSGGEKRRLGLAATLLETHLRMLIADEPTTGMDPDSEQLVMETLKGISRQGITVLTITHSVVSAGLMDRVLILTKKDERSGARVGYAGEPPQSPMVLINYINGKTPSGISDLSAEKTDTKERSKPQKKTRRIAKKDLWFKQMPQWFCASGKLILRDKIGLGGLVVMAVLCVLAIQIGTCSYTGNNSENTMLTLCSLAAPWLCAMYSAVYISDFKHFYSWEYFSGLKALSFFWGTLIAQLFPASLIALIFTTGLYVAVNTNHIVKSALGGIVCSQYTYDIKVREDTSLKEYILGKKLPEQLEIVKSLYECNQQILLQKVLNIFPNSMQHHELKDLAGKICSQCPGIKFTDSSFTISHAQKASLSNKIPWFKEPGKIQRDKYEYVDEQDVLPANAEVIHQISDKDYTSDNMKETIEYLYKYHNRKLLSCVLDYVSINDIANWQTAIDGCPGIVLNPAGTFPRYKINSWEGTCWFPKLKAFLGKGYGGATASGKNNLLQRIFAVEEKHSIVWHPVQELFRSISLGQDNNYPLAQKAAEPSLNIVSFAKVFLTVLLVTLIGGALGMTATLCFGNSRASTISVLVVFVVFIIFSRLFIIDANHVSYLQPFAENLMGSRGIAFGENGILLPISLSYICLGRYASNLIAYRFTNANLIGEYMYMILVFLLCMCISLYYLRKGRFAKFQH